MRIGWRLPGRRPLALRRLGRLGRRVLRGSRVALSLTVALTRLLVALRRLGTVRTGLALRPGLVPVAVAL